MKKLFTLFTAVLFAVMSLNLNTLTVSADGPATYYVKYDEATQEWWYQEGSGWDNTVAGKDIYFFHEALKDGDYVVVEGTSGDQELHINKTLGNLTIMANAKCSVYANGVQDCYILSGAIANIHSNVTNGYLYDFSVCNFYNDCTNLTISYTDLPTISVVVVGKCNNFKVQTFDQTTVKYQAYNFTTMLVFEESEIKNAATEYSTTPTAAPAAPAKPAAPADEYDDVPKTADSYAYILAFGVAALCFTGSYLLKKRA